MPSVLIVSLRKFAGWVGVSTLILAAHAAYADTTAPAPDENTVVIEKFNVSAAPAHGYNASETMAGSRVNTKIIDLPYSTVNLTDQYFKDFGTNILDENMTQIGGLTGLSIGGNFLLRGFNSTSQLRDGFYRLGRYGQSNIERVEIIRGPNAAIYGRTAPGGMVNFISLQPKKQNSQEIYIANGGYDNRQERLRATGSLGSSQKTYYVISLDQTERRFDGQFDHIRNNEDLISVRHDFSDTSHILVLAEYYLQVQHAPQAAAPAMFITRTATPDNSATTHAIGYDEALAQVNAYGPHSELNRGDVSFTTSYDKSFNDVWSLHLAANNSRARRWDFNQNTGWVSFTLPANGSNPTDARGATPTKGLIQEDAGGVQADLLAHYFFLHHSVENNSLLTIDFNDYYRYDPTWNVGNDPAFQAWASQRSVTLFPVLNKNKQPNFAPSGPIPYFGEGFVWGQETLTTLTRRRTTSVGGNLKQQMYFFHGRLIGFAGVRYDAVRFNQRDYTVQFPNVGYPSNPNGTGQVRRYFHETKPNFGFNAEVVKNLHVYGSYSQSYFVDQTSRPAVIAGWQAVAATKTVPAHFVPAAFQPETAKGYDYGLKGSFFDERLNFTLGGFYASRYHVAVTDVEVDPTTGSFVTVSRTDGNQVDKGAEFDLNWLPNDNLSLTVSAATVNAKYTNFGVNNPEAIGRSVNFVSPENGSVSAKYTFSHGPAKGLDLEASVTYVSSTPSEIPTAGDTTDPVTHAVTAHTDQWTLRTPSSTVWTFGLHYTLPWQWKHIQQTLGLTVHNAFNKYYMKYGSTATLTNNQADARWFEVSYDIAHF
jgi:outer membrane receptor protein involved in Fe transport